MKSIFVFLFMLKSVCSIGQTKNEYEIDACDQGGQQTMNICKSEALKKLDKIMRNKYDCLVASLDKAIRNSLQDDKDGYVKIRAAILKSQATWELLQSQNVELYTNFYDGGSILPMVYASSKIKDVQDRLERLDDFIETLEQDSNLHCQ